MKKQKSFILIIPFAIAAFSVAVMFLWNALLPEIFGLPEITFWQSLGLLVLTRILFSGIGMHRPGSMMHGVGKKHLKEKWKNMSKEERQNFVHNMHHHYFQEHWNSKCYNDTGKWNNKCNSSASNAVNDADNNVVSNINSNSNG